MLMIHLIHLMHLVQVVHKKMQLMYVHVQLVCLILNPLVIAAVFLRGEESPTHSHGFIKKQVCCVL